MNQEEFWPTGAVDMWAAYFDGLYFKNAYHVRRTIGYKLVYLEFLQIELKRHLFEPVALEARKTFCLTCVSIVEIILHLLVANERMLKLKDWEEIRSMRRKGKEYANQTEIRRDSTIVEKKLRPPQQEDSPSLKSLIDKVNGNNLISDIPTDWFDRANAARRIRNKIHIGTALHDYQSDLNVFGTVEAERCSELLWDLLNSSAFSSKTAPRRIEFLRPGFDTWPHRETS